MRRVAIIFCAALWIAPPTISYAQYNDIDRQNPTEYHDEDSQPIALLADLLYPVGFVLEWTLARPIHYIVAESPAAPIFRPVGGNDMTPPAPIPIIPDNTVEAASTTSQDWSPTRSPVTTNATVINQASPPSAAPLSNQPAPAPSVAPSSNQPALH
jgi:hypothetical protein